MVASLQHEYVHCVCLTCAFVVYLFIQEAPVFFFSFDDVPVAAIETASGKHKD